MSLRSKIYKGAIVLTGGQAATQALSFTRNIIIARILNPEDMGIAATFAITITLLEMISNLAVDMLLLQAKDGDDPIFQGTAQLYQVFRGILVGLFILFCAPLITWLFDTPQAEWAYRLVALVPVFRGFMHLDWKRLQRNMEYRTAVIVELIPQAIVVLAAFPMATWRGDYSAVLWLVLMQALAGLLVSHLFAQRPYRLTWDRDFAYRLIIFGWPLLINGLLMFGSLQGDRVIIGTFYSMAELGIFSVAFSLILTLAGVFGKMSISILLPLLANVQDIQEKFKHRYVLSTHVFALSGGLVTIPLLTVGGYLIIFVFGDQYAPAFSFVPWLGGLIAVRIYRFAPTAAALARGDTKNSMFANIFRVIGVIAAVVVAAQRLPLSAIIICGIGGEVLALLFVTCRLKMLYGVKIADSLLAPLIVSIILILVGIKNIFFFEATSISRDLGFCFGSLLIFILVVIIFSPLIRYEIQKGAIYLSGRFLKRKSV